MQADLGEYFRPAFTSWFGSPYWVALCMNKSFLLSPWHGQPPCLKWKYNMSIIWKLWQWISITINNSSCIQIGLSVINHESFEVWIGNTIICHDFVDSTTLHSELLCLQITYHISQSSSPWCKKNHTHGKRMSSNLRHILHYQTWSKWFGGRPRTISVWQYHNHYHFHA